jgi:hypothetical protein
MESVSSDKYQRDQDLDGHSKPTLTRPGLEKSRQSGGQREDDASKDGNEGQRHRAWRGPRHGPIEEPLHRESILARESTVGSDRHQDKYADRESSDKCLNHGLLPFKLDNPKWICPRLNRAVE